MLNKSLALLMVVLITPILLIAGWIPSDKNKSIQSPPKVTLVSDDNNSTVLKIEISGFDLKEFTSDGKTYQLADLLSESFTTNSGFPKIPYVAKILAIPDRKSVSIEVLESGEMQTFDNIHLPPARESWFEGNQESTYSENPKAYNSKIAYPNEVISLEKPSVFRDLRILRVSVFPLRYIPATKQLQVVSSITVRINYNSGKANNPKTGPKRQIAPSFGKLYRSSIFNYQSVLDKSYGGKEDGHELMLCIMPDDFFDSFQSYAVWKRKSGIDIHITKFSDIGANSNDASIIRNHITDAYNNWEVPPTYVLLVGDAGLVPYYTSSGYPDENNFVAIDGDDYFPEMMLGRFTNQSDYGMQVMTNKFLMYERTPYTASTHWFKKGICCSNDAYASQIETKRFAAKQMLQNGNFISVDTMMSDPGCTYNKADVINAINEGRSFLNYRGEGWSNGWWATCTPVQISDLGGVNNGQKFTFVTSIGCGVAMFAGHCFGEEWVEMGTLSNPKGAIGFIGPGGNTHTTYNNKIDKGIYVGMFDEGMDTPGQAMLRGKLYMYNVFGNIYNVEYHYKIYLIIGDPSIHIWKDVPQEVTVDYHPATIPFGVTTVEFSVAHTSTSLPVKNAVVCVTGDTLFSTCFTDEEGKAYLEFEVSELETFDVVVRGGNVVPFQGTIIVTPPVGPYIIHQSIELNDESGNNNGIMETSESILATLTVENIGVEIAENVTVTIQTTDEYVNITDNSELYDNIDVYATAFVTDGFAWEVADDIPDLHNVIFEVHATDGTETWLSYFEIPGHAPELEIGNLIIDDSTQGNGNGHLEAGETVNIYIEAYNNGSFEAINTLGEMFTENPLITLNNNTHDFGTIESGTMEEAVFNITIDESAPHCEQVEFNFNLTSGGYFIEKSFSKKIGLILENWEVGNLTQFDWQTGGGSNWFVTDNNPFEGVYCARSGNIGNNKESWLELNYEVIDTDAISFYFKVSSETNSDYLRFFINNNQMEEWSGQIGWQKAAYTVAAGNYTFRWEYKKNMLASNGSDCAWIDYISLPNTVLQAHFGAINNKTCIDDMVQFNNESTGQPTSWQWTFEGGSPASSTEQNPIVLYTTEGNYDVTLIVSDGVSFDTLMLIDYIAVSSFPDIPPMPSGPDVVCGNDLVSSYYTTGLSGIESYAWQVEPSEAGIVNGSGLTSIIIWEEGFLGETTLKVASENICGTSDYSDAFNISRYLPEVTLDQFEWICLDWPSIELSGGMPEGGEYFGTGVENGWFNPSTAGIGTHTITYTYSDANSCENFAEETILVDPCTGINDITKDSEIDIYPNPSTGIITIHFENEIGIVEVTVVNALNNVVHSESITSSQKKLNIDLSNQAKGTYLVLIKSDNKEEKQKIILK